MYDASLGRFHTVDPLAEEYHVQSPYVYAANNPIRYIDWMGMGPGEGPFKAGSNVYTKNGHIVAYRITSQQRKGSNLAFTLATSFVPGGSVMSLGSNLMSGNYGGAALGAGQSGMNFTSALFAHEAKEQIKNSGSVPESAKALKNMSSSLKFFSKGLTAFNIASSVSGGPTRNEVLQGTTFSIAKGTMESTFGAHQINDSFMGFLNDDLTEEEVASGLNTIYNVLDAFLSEFDLENEDDRSAATDYLNDNYKFVIHTINQLIQNQNENDDDDE